MIKYNVYHQRPPLPTGVKDEYRANLVFIGKVCALSGERAIEAARKEFNLRWPVVHELDDAGWEVWRQPSYFDS